MPSGDSNSYINCKNHIDFRIIIIQSMAKGIKKCSKVKETCSICMVRQNNSQAVECGHEFCYRCLSKWSRRKGNCPICRQDVRKIFYKNKVTQPDFLKIFDEENTLLSEEIQINPRRVRVMPYIIVNPANFISMALQQTMFSQFTQTVNFFTFPYNPPS